MIAPWTVEAAFAALAIRPNDRRIREALCMDDPDCGVCSSRLQFSDREACGLDVPPCRNVFAMRARRPLWRRLW